MAYRQPTERRDRSSDLAPTSYLEHCLEQVQGLPGKTQDSLEQLRALDDKVNSLMGDANAAVQSTISRATTKNMPAENARRSYQELLHVQRAITDSATKKVSAAVALSELINDVYSDVEKKILDFEVLLKKDGRWPSVGDEDNPAGSTAALQPGTKNNRRSSGRASPTGTAMESVLKKLGEYSNENNNNSNSNINNSINNNRISSKNNNSNHKISSKNVINSTDGSAVLIKQELVLGKAVGGEQNPKDANSKANANGANTAEENKLTSSAVNSANFKTKADAANKGNPNSSQMLSSQQTDDMNSTQHSMDLDMTQSDEMGNIPANGGGAGGGKGQMLLSATGSLKRQKTEHESHAMRETLEAHQNELSQNQDEDKRQEDSEANENNMNRNNSLNNDTEVTDNTLYCKCRNVSHGPMIACEGKDCPYEWFHFECVGVVSEPPEGTAWYCDDCKEQMRRKSTSNRRKLSSSTTTSSSSTAHQPQ